MASGGRIELCTLKRCWYQGRPGRSKDLLQWAKQSPPLDLPARPRDTPHRALPVPPQQPIEIVNTTPKVVPAVDLGADERGAAEGRAPAVIARAAAVLPAKPSKWWMLLLIIPAIATGLAVVALQFHPALKERRQGTLFKSFERRWNWQARLAGQFDLMGDNITRWSHRASRPVQIDPTSPSSEATAASLVQAQEHANHASVHLEQNKQFADDIRSQVADKSCELAELNERLMALGDLLLAAPGLHRWQA